jgi:hypothetical protein
VTWFRWRRSGKNAERLDEAAARKALFPRRRGYTPGLPWAKTPPPNGVQIIELPADSADFALGPGETPNRRFDELSLEEQEQVRQIQSERDAGAQQHEKAEKPRSKPDIRAGMTEAEIRAAGIAIDLPFEFPNPKNTPLYTDDFEDGKLTERAKGRPGIDKEPDAEP